MAKVNGFKKCPRCNEKNYINAKVCDNCKLVFARLEYASNKKAKQAIKAGKRKEEVIMTTTFPKDRNRWALFFICLFGGALGIHNIHIGRYIKGFFSFFFTILTGVLISVLQPELQTYLFENYLFIPAGIVFMFWFYDLFMIGIGKYKIPIALDMPINVGEK